MKTKQPIQSTSWLKVKSMIILLLLLTNGIDSGGVKAANLLHSGSTVRAAWGKRITARVPNGPWIFPLPATQIHYTTETAVFYADMQRKAEFRAFKLSQRLYRFLITDAYDLLHPGQYYHWHQWWESIDEPLSL